MKHSGLKNRFPDKVRKVWIYHIHCLYCSKNMWDTLHHIISPGSSLYIPGPHNKSIFNSCPIHNYKHPNDPKPQNCHFGNEGKLTKKETIVSLLHSVYRELSLMG